MTAPNRPVSSSLRQRLARVRALSRKESREMVRDPSSIGIGIVLPLILILLFGFGLSLDVRHVPIGLVLEQPSGEAVNLTEAFRLSPYFQPIILHAMAPAEQLLAHGHVDGIVDIPSDFARRLTAGNARLQLIVNGSDANSARIIEGYVEGAVGAWSAQRVAEGRPGALAQAAGPVNVQSRLWFNEADESRYFLVPGLLVLVMTLIGGLLTAMVMAREWELGTLEALFVTPVRSGEILLGKTLPYFLLALVGFVLCVLSAEFLFQVPLRGSLWVLSLASM
ncbi:MAG TPA: ABC transporter permease, partial [Steroidobacteraceae bacterium]|nr:ABC transporter permease [Steroidobacteraceae bacterium]